MDEAGDFRAGTAAYPRWHSEIFRYAEPSQSPPLSIVPEGHIRDTSDNRGHKVRGDGVRLLPDRGVLF